MDTKKCRKCGKELPIEQFKKQPICRKCKRKRRAKLIMIILLALLIGGLGFCYYRRIHSFGGINGINENIKVQKPTSAYSFDMSKCMVVGETQMNGTVEDIESFKRAIQLAQDKAKQTKKIAIPSVGTLFELNSSELSSRSVALLKEYSSIYLATNKKAKILIEGYTCNIGTMKENDILSRQRAEAVKSELSKSGVPENLISVKWYGERRFDSFHYKSINEYRRVNVSIEHD